MAFELQIGVGSSVDQCLRSVDAKRLDAIERALSPDQTKANKEKVPSMGFGLEFGGHEAAQAANWTKTEAENCKGQAQRGKVSAGRAAHFPQLKQRAN